MLKSREPINSSVLLDWFIYFFVWGLVGVGGAGIARPHLNLILILHALTAGVSSFIFFSFFGGGVAGGQVLRGHI